MRWAYTVVGSSAALVPIFIPRCRIKLREFAAVVDGLLCSGVDTVVNLHNGRLVSAPVAVIGGTKNRHHSLVVLPLVALHDELVGSANEAQAIHMTKLFCNVLAECIPCPAGTYSPTTPIVRITPNQIAHWALVGYLLDAVESPSMVEGVD